MPTTSQQQGTCWTRRRSTATGQEVIEVQRLWKVLYNLPDSFRTDGSQWDKLFSDGEQFNIGNLTCEVLLSPGHTLASITYVVSDAVFIHDTLFMPDGGPRDAISQAAAPKLSGTPSNASSRCLTTHACSPDMTTCRGVVNRNGEHGRAAEGREHSPAQGNNRR